jgi:hypothetical protein
MLKIVTLFLVVMVVVAMVNRWRMRGAKLPGPASSQRCTKCKRYLIGKGPCECGTPHP